MFLLQQRDNTSLYNWFTVENFSTFEDAEKTANLLISLIKNINEGQSVNVELPSYRITKYWKQYSDMFQDEEGNLFQHNVD